MITYSVNFKDSFFIVHAERFELVTVTYSFGDSDSFIHFYVSDSIVCTVDLEHVESVDQLDNETETFNKVFTNRVHSND